jgi:BirA family transcriptional regulator, biotin operon repressor / biotin---[acetyl-CoA-carboxylase] ligase
MNQSKLNKLLSKLPIGDIKSFDSIGSTNDEALDWATKAAKDLSLVVADEQTAGRGRLDRKWFTPPGTALAFSLILRPTAAERPHLSRMVGLAALSVADSLLARGLSPQIKWPNDILLNERKVAGILIESVWSGEGLDCIVIGMGVNILKGAVPDPDMLLFPATSLENALGYPVERAEVLHDILAALIVLRPQLNTNEFMAKWERLLAYRDRQVQVERGVEGSVIGNVSGLEKDGSLRLRDQDGKSLTVQFGDVRLRRFA